METRVQAGREMGCRAPAFSLLPMSCGSVLSESLGLGGPFLCGGGGVGWESPGAVVFPSFPETGATVG